MSVTAKLSAITGVHCSDAAEYNVAGWRQPLSWARRLQEWIDASNTFDADVAINFGDTVDANTTDDLMLDFLNGSTSFLSLTTDTDNGLARPRLDIPGNHIFGGTVDPGYDPIWDGAGDKPTIQDYFDNISDQTSGQSVSKGNVFVPTGGLAGEPYGYTSEIDGVRYIIVYMPTGGVVSGDVLTWLEARISESTLPIVVCSHAHLWDDPNHTLTVTWRADDASVALLYAIFDAYPLVQLVLGGHKHEHAWHYKRNGVHYLSFGGSVGIPYRGYSPPVNNYAMITLTTQTIPTLYGMKASLLSSGTGIYAGRSNVTEEKFGVA